MAPREPNRVANIARRLGLACFFAALAWFGFAAYGDWPLPAFLERLDDESFHTAAVVITLALYWVGERLAPR